MAGKKNMTPEEVAAKYNPLWQPMPPHDSQTTVATETDDVSPDLAELRRKFLGDDAPPAMAKEKGARCSGPIKMMKVSASAAKMVKMVPKDSSDISVGSKTVVVHGDKIIGETG